MDAFFCVIFIKIKHKIMIALPVNQILEDHRKDQRELLLKSYSNSGSILEKSEAISLNDFSENYPSEKFEFFSEELVESFKSEMNKSEDFDSDFLKSELDSLSKVSVNSEGSSVVNFYVKAKQVEDDK